LALFWIKRISVLTFVLFPSLVWGRSYKDFSQSKARIGEGKILTLYLAYTDEDRSLGLMRAKSLGQDEGVLFIFEDAEPLNFWMKNTFLPLSIGFFNKDGILNEVLDMTPVKSVLQMEIPRYPSKNPARYALEMNQGWFARSHVRPGCPLHLIDINKTIKSLSDLSPALKKSLLKLGEHRKCAPVGASKGN